MTLSLNIHSFTQPEPAVDCCSADMNDLVTGEIEEKLHFFYTDGRISYQAFS